MNAWIRTLTLGAVAAFATSALANAHLEGMDPKYTKLPGWMHKGSLKLAAKHGGAGQRGAALDAKATDVDDDMHKGSLKLRAKHGKN